MLADRIKVTTSTTGTGSLTLGATGVRDATNGDCLAPAERLAALANRKVSYEIINGNKFGGGKSILSSDGLTLPRDPNECSWDGSGPLAFTPLNIISGTSTVFITPHASDLNAGSIGKSACARQAWG